MPGLSIAILALTAYVGYRWPRRWVALVPLALAGVITAITVLTGDWSPTPSGDNEGAIVLLATSGLVLLGELSLCVGAFARARSDRRRGLVVPARLAFRAGVGNVAAGIVYSCAFEILDEAQPLVVGVLLAATLLSGVWLVRLGRARVPAHQHRADDGDVSGT